MRQSSHVELSNHNGHQPGCPWLRTAHVSLNGTNDKTSMYSLNPLIETRDVFVNHLYKLILSVAQRLITGISCIK